MVEACKRLVFVDFEFDKIAPGYTDELGIAKFEIVEFGAVMIDTQKNEISTFQSYVKPVYVEKISRFLRKNCGITAELLEDKEDFATVFKAFVEWCEMDGSEYLIYAWSETDLKTITKEIKLKNIELTDSIKYMLENWKDLQLEYDSTLGFNRQQSLLDAVFMAGLEFDGEAHHALDDARNTANLYRFLTDPVECETTIKNIQRAMKPEKNVITLGDTIDWSAIMAIVS